MVAHAIARFDAGLVAAAAWLRSLTGRRQAAAAAVLGICAAAALPPAHAVPLLLIAFPGLVWLLAGATRGRSALAIGWWFGFGHFVAGLYWIANALLVDAARFGWMVPFGVFGLSAYFAVYPALAAWLLWVSRAQGLAAVCVLAAAWTLTEWLRGYIFTGFAWNLIATVWVETPIMAQPAAWVGGYGLGLLTVVLFTLPVTVGTLSANHGRRWIGVGLAAGLLVAWWTAGEIRLSGAEGGTVAGVRLRLVQPDIPQNLRWDPERVEQNLRDTVALTRAPGFETRTHVVWPESGVTYDLANIPALREQLGEAVVPAGGLLMTGALRTNNERGSGFRIWNSLYALDARGDVRGVFDKFHLVPFGEYMPAWVAWLGVSRIAQGGGGTGFSTGPGPVTLSLPGLPEVSPLICYEIIFPDHVVDDTARPRWILNVTNDAWFGMSAGPYQHFAAARLRAVEEGLPVVRSANNGISGVIDPYGRVTARLGLGLRGVVDADLPQAIDATLFAKFGDLMALIASIVVLVIAWPMTAFATRPRHDHM
jgi:apolipoprotein N-acyltransferase